MAGLGVGAMGTMLGVPFPISMAAGMGVDFAFSAASRGAESVMMMDQLNKNFQFSSASSRSGFGFGRGDRDSLRKTIQGMSYSKEISADFEEIVRVTDKLAKQGNFFGQTQISSVQRQLKDSLRAIKDLAKMTGSTLEEALPLFGQFRSMGLSTREIGAFGRQAVATSGIIGLGQGTVMNAAYGGVQRALAAGQSARMGADMGIRGVGDISVMVRNGMLSREDIFHMTGESDPEAGVAALSNRINDIGQRFSQTGIGTVMYAALAEKDGDRFTGRLDSGKVALAMKGRYSQGDLQSMAQKNLRGRESMVSFQAQKDELAFAAQAQLGAGGMFSLYDQMLDGKGFSDAERRLLLEHQGMSSKEAELIQKLSRSLNKIRDERIAKMTQQIIMTDERARAKRERSIEGRLQDVRRTVDRVLSPLSEFGASAANYLSRGMETMSDVFYFGNRPKEVLPDEGSVGLMGNISGPKSLDSYLSTNRSKGVTEHIFDALTSPSTGSLLSNKDLTSWSNLRNLSEKDIASAQSDKNVQRELDFLMGKGDTPEERLQYALKNREKFPNLLNLGRLGTERRDFRDPGSSSRLAKNLSNLADATGVGYAPRGSELSGVIGSEIATRLSNKRSTTDRELADALNSVLGSKSGVANESVRRMFERPEFLNAVAKDQFTEGALFTDPKALALIQGASNLSPQGRTNLLKGHSNYLSKLGIRSENDLLGAEMLLKKGGSAALLKAAELGKSQLDESIRQKYSTFGGIMKGSLESAFGAGSPAAMGSLSLIGASSKLASAMMGTDDYDCASKSLYKAVLGASEKDFSAFTNRLGESDSQGNAALIDLVTNLRSIKSGKSVGGIRGASAFLGKKGTELLSEEDAQRLAEAAINNGLFSSVSGSVSGRTGVGSTGSEIADTLTADFSAAQTAVSKFVGQVESATLGLERFTRAFPGAGGAAFLPEMSGGQ